MKAFCCECGRPVPIRFVTSADGEPGKWVTGHCRIHPQAKRFSDGFVARQFAAARAVLDAITESPGRVFGPSATYWSVMDARARGGAQ